MQLQLLMTSVRVVIKNVNERMRSITNIQPKIRASTRRHGLFVSRLFVDVRRISFVP